MSTPNAKTCPRCGKISPFFVTRCDQCAHVFPNRFPETGGIDPSESLYIVMGTNGVESPPLPLRDLLDHARQGFIQPHTQICDTERRQWIRADAIPPLKTVLASKTALESDPKATVPPADTLGKVAARSGFSRSEFIVRLAILAGAAWWFIPSSYYPWNRWAPKPEASSLVLGDWNVHSESIDGEIKNASGAPYSYVGVSFNLFDSQGNQIGTALDNTTNLEPGRTWKFHAVVLTDTAVSSAKIGDVTGYR